MDLTYETTEFQNIPDDCIAVICEFCQTRTLVDLCLVSKNFRWKRFLIARIQKEKVKSIVSLLLDPLTTLSYFHDHLSNFDDLDSIGICNFQKREKTFIPKKYKGRLTDELANTLLKCLDTCIDELLRKKLIDWNREMTLKWVREIKGLENAQSCIRIFQDNDIDGVIVPEIDEITYRNIGISKHDSDLLLTEYKVMKKIDKYASSTKQRSKSKCSIM